MHLTLFICALLFTAVPFLYSQKKQLNVARPDTHPYVSPEGGRDGHRLTDKGVNKYRVYNFYQRQADYYMKQGKNIVQVPAYPGLDAGKHGHWGKYNQNGHRDDRWNQMQNDGIYGALITSKVYSGEDGIAVVLNREKQMYAVFSPRNFNVMLFAKGKFLTTDSFRWGTSRGAKVNGQIVASSPAIKADKVTSKYHGYFKYDSSYIFSYTINGSKLLDMPTTVGDTFCRQFEVQSEIKNLALALAKDKKPVIKADKGIKYSFKDNQLIIESAKAGDLFKLYYNSPKAPADDKLIKLSKMIKGGKATLSGYRYMSTGTNAADDKAYVVDDINIPFKNKQNSLMFFTGIDFNKDGIAFISTLQGEIWRVSGLDKSLTKVQWQKIASGLNQPFGLRIWDDKIHVLERTRITTLEDLNGDGEIDKFGCYDNQMSVRARSHSHKFGIVKDLNGTIYFASDTRVSRVTKDGKFKVIANGLRNNMAVGSLRDGTILMGPQEGTNTPTSSIFEVKEGDTYGHKTKGALTAPMAYVPRGVDNSTGGFYHMNDKRFGPLGNSIIGLSYGYGSWYQILRQKLKDRSQAATVPMEGDFMAGVVRAAQNPKDGQLYTVGLDGWGDYSTQDGCFHRIRYTGKALYKPTGFKIFYNGIKIDFPVKLDAKAITDTKRYFAQMWNYLNARQYGSPEYTVHNPGKLGHDLLDVTAVKIIEGGQSIFVEIPHIQTVMQMHLRMHLKAADGTDFKTDIFPTVKDLGEFYEFDGAQAKLEGKSNHFTVFTKKEKISPLHTQSGSKDDHARKVVISTKNLKFSLNEFKLKAGESVLLELKNDDAMPHNLVIVADKDYENVGMTSFKMLNNPDALKMHYVPKMKEVIAYTYVIQPKGSHKLYFKAPSKPGKYIFFCSYPGHWRLMKGTVIVE